MCRKVLLVFILGIFVWETIQYWPVTIYVSGSIPEQNFSIRMPLKDRKNLEWFFRNACFFNAWAYTLLGSKPISTHQYVKPWIQLRKVSKYTLAHLSDFPLSFREICYLLTPEQVKIRSGWIALNKYIRLFPNSRFAIFTHNNEDAVCLSLVNKKSLVEIVASHLQDFRETLQRLEYEPEGLYDNEKLSLFLDRLDNDGLIGIVLGFGRGNATLYQSCRETDWKEWPMVSMWEEEDEEWQERVHKKNRSFRCWDESDLFYPYFACDPKLEETRILKQTYREERERIIRYYNGKDVVEATLSLFNQRL